MIPGKIFKPQDLIGILQRRYWLVLVPFAIVAAGTAVVARLLPDLYRSDALILVVPQRVPESYVRPTANQRIEDRLQSIAQQIMSRTRLERIIQDFNLYPNERRTGIMEDVVEKMRQDISLQIVKGDAFRVGFSGGDPRTVMRVTDRLASLFIEENLRDSEVLAEGTNQFLDAQLEDARRRLVETEKKLEEYKAKHAGELPQQLESNLQAVSSTENRLQALAESLNRDRDRHLLLEKQVVELENSVEASNNDVGGPSMSQAERDLAEARDSLKALQLRLKPEHPDVVRTKRIVAELEQKVAGESTGDVPVSSAPSVSAAERARRKRLADTKEELAQLDAQMQAKQAEEKRMRSVATAYQSRVEGVPKRESEMTELLRDYSTLQAAYTGLLSKKEDSQLQANIIRRQIGEQFKLLDPARLPEKPFSPNRERINTLGLLGGLVLGVLLVAFMEFRDSTFKTDEEVFDVLSLPVLAIVPAMQSVAESRRNFKVRLAIHAGCATTVIACLAVVVYTYVR